jgi:hypothetical protein
MYSKLACTMAGSARLTSPPATVPPCTRQGCLVLASARFGFPGRWHTCRCGDLHSPHPAFSRRCEPVAGAVREHLRMPPMRPLGASGFAGIAVFTCPRNARRRSARVGSRVRPSFSPSSALTPGMPGAGRSPSGRPPRPTARPGHMGACPPPRPIQRHEHLGADDAHITLKVPQLDLAQGQTLTLQPPQVIH